jgi:hypothetical protein
MNQAEGLVLFGKSGSRWFCNINGFEHLQLIALCASTSLISKSEHSISITVDRIDFI